MTVMGFISDPQQGQINGSTSYTLATSRAHAERQARWGTVRVGVGMGWEGDCQGWKSLHAAGARRATWGQCCQRALQREAYKP
jgi:hypothetical protein